MLLARDFERSFTWRSFSRALSWLEPSLCSSGVTMGDKGITAGAVPGDTSACNSLDAPKTGALCGDFRACSLSDSKGSSISSISDLVFGNLRARSLFDSDRPAVSNASGNITSERGCGGGLTRRASAPGGSDSEAATGGASSTAAENVTPLVFRCAFLWCSASSRFLRRGLFDVLLGASSCAPCLQSFLQLSHSIASLDDGFSIP